MSRFSLLIIILAFTGFCLDIGAAAWLGFQSNAGSANVIYQYDFLGIKIFGFIIICFFMWLFRSRSEDVSHYVQNHRFMVFFKELRHYYFSRTATEQTESPQGISAEPIVSVTLLYTILVNLALSMAVVAVSTVVGFLTGYELMDIVILFFMPIMEAINGVLPPFVFVGLAFCIGIFFVLPVGYYLSRGISRI